MELLFLLILILSMVAALGAGFPVAFALPGSAIFTIGLAGLTGALFMGDSGAFFAHGDPAQWLNAGVTNFRGIYWEVERDTLIAIPLFIFMGIMLERSKIAEDLLIAMAQMFGTVPGGLGISVVVVGALLAATTGIVGATVIAMGLISLPVMLRANYSHALATGTISASGTLGQIIPPSIVLIILADQLANATDQAAALRTADYKAATGEFSLPTEFGLTSTSAGDMFMGAFIPGLVLVGLYILFILGVALLRPHAAPPAPYEGKMDVRFFARVLLVLAPPLGLIVCVLGSIVAGVATVNQAGAIGAAGALVMAGYRLRAGQRGAFRPALAAGAGLIGLTVVLSIFDVNIRSVRTPEDQIGLWLAAVSSIVLTAAVIWSAVRAFRIEDTLMGVMVETAKTTSLVFIILLGAAMLTAAFRAFGGEDMVRELLSGLPGGFYTKFIVVMAVIFILGFFLDFIEIAVVVVPIIAPILLADPEANITAVWLGVMIGLNMQTSFLTPPFGFALFYLRGVAPAAVKTLSMYKGVVPFIALQLLALAVVGAAPQLVNYLPTKISLTSENAPPPKNPRLQACLEPELHSRIDNAWPEIRRALDDLAGRNAAMLPKAHADALGGAVLQGLRTVPENIARVRASAAALAAAADAFRSPHRELRSLRVKYGGDTAAVERNAPEGWAEARRAYRAAFIEDKRNRQAVRRAADAANDALSGLAAVIGARESLSVLRGGIAALSGAVSGPDAAERIAVLEKRLRGTPGGGDITASLVKARRALESDQPNRVVAMAEIDRALALHMAEVEWRRAAAESLSGSLANLQAALAENAGVRALRRLPDDLAEMVAVCRSRHQDISLNF
ncbi:MAG: TRAP transporter large permease [Rhodospirillales bacterium]